MKTLAQTREYVVSYQKNRKLHTAAFSSLESAKSYFTDKYFGEKIKSTLLRTRVSSIVEFEGDENQTKSEERVRQSRDMEGLRNLGFCKPYRSKK